MLEVAYKYSVKCCTLITVRPSLFSSMVINRYIDIQCVLEICCVDGLDILETISLLVLVMQLYVCILPKSSLFINTIDIRRPHKFTRRDFYCAFDSFAAVIMMPVSGYSYCQIAELKRKMKFEEIRICPGV